MYSDSNLTSFLQTSSSIKTQSKIIAEWNLNIFDNIDTIGNYFYKTGTTLTTTFAKETSATLNPKYFGGTNYDVVIDGGYDYTGTIPLSYTKQNEQQKALMSLEDCFKRFRPRSGINKFRYIAGNKLPASTSNMYQRPRYYLAGPNDNFKYWSSYRKTNISNTAETATGISDATTKKIEDVAPFIVYKNKLPTNRIIIKIQTNTGDGQMINDNGTSTVDKDYFYSGYSGNYKSTPVDWKLEKLDVDGVTWISTPLFSVSSDVFPTDGYLELAYGLNNTEILTTYADTFNFIGYLSNTNSLPALNTNQKGFGYIVQTNSTDLGSLYIWTGTSWSTAITPSYGWYQASAVVNNSQSYLSDLALNNAASYVSSGKTIYRQFEYVQGLRLSVKEMKNPNTTFDLIELSPRLAADISDMTLSYNIKKIASDIGVSSFPVGQLLASSGNLQIFDYNQVFNQSNSNSLLNIYSGNQFQFTFASKNLQFKIYEKLLQVVQGDGTYKDYTIPIKTMYTDGYPEYDNSNRQINFNLRDFYFYFESITAPQIMMQNAPLSSIIATLLDGIGYTNYIFKRSTISGVNESDPVIPYFFVAPNRTIIQVLNDLAQATQTSMFFDENNNFVCMTKGFLIPDKTSTRLTDTSNIVTLLGNDSGSNKANIIDIKSINNDIYNDGKIVYRNRYIEKEISSLSQVNNLDKDKNWRYKPVLLWEASGQDTTKSINEQSSTTSSYTLSAIPLNTTLSNNLPVVTNISGTTTLINSTMDLGDGIYFMSRYNGYLYANGEIIKYDAIEYSISGIGTRFITSQEEYQKYFSTLKFGGQMYPTGNVRIYAEPNYNSDGSLVLGDVIKHGRGQFGTPVVTHYSGLDTDIDWQTTQTVVSDWQTIFRSSYNVSTLNYIESGVEKIKTLNATTSTKIKNYWGRQSFDPVTKKSTYTDSLQSSALVFNGITLSDNIKRLSAISYSIKDLTSIKGTDGKTTPFDTYGTRLRIIGNQVSNSTLQNANGASSLYTVTNTDGSSNSVSGGSGGICINVDSSGNGYYYEIAALSQTDTTSLIDADKNSYYNIFFYKMVSFEYKRTTNLSGTFDSNAKTLTANTNGKITSISEFSKAVVGTRVRLNNQSVDAETGNYVVTDVGSTTSKWVLTKTQSLKPVMLHQNFTQIIVDDGLFTGQGRNSTDTNPTVYDLSIKSDPVLASDGSRLFSLYLNNSLVKSVIDKNPLPTIQNVGTFVRGSSQLMFENIFALQNKDFNTKGPTYQQFNSIFSSQNFDTSMNKYAVSGILQSSYLNTISPNSTSSKTLYYDEFGTIMREMSYFNIKFDKAYPALYSMIAPTFTNSKGFVVSGYKQNSYGAEFLIFNATDSILSLDSTSGNYLRILGISFTQEAIHDLTVDDYYSKLSSPTIGDGTLKTTSPGTYQKQYIDIKNSRITYGVKSFTIDSPYIQNYSSAKSLMDWIMPKISKPRRSVGLDVFGLPILQLGDIVKINYTSSGIDQIYDASSNFVIYSIEYSKNPQGPSMLVYVSEVV